MNKHRGKFSGGVQRKTTRRINLGFCSYCPNVVYWGDADIVPQGNGVHNLVVHKACKIKFGSA